MSNPCSSVTSVLHNLKLRSETPFSAVEERAELTTVDVVLHVAWVPVVCDVEDRQSNTTLVLLPAEGNRHAFSYQHIKREQTREAPAFVSRADEVLIFINE